MKRILGILWLCWGLSACNRLGSSATITDAPTLPTHVHEASDAALQALYKKITAQGVQIETVGQMVVLRIPAHLLFFENSPRITWHAYSLLNDVVCYLQLLRKIAVHVQGFANCCGSKNRTRALTLARARVVGHYLWSQNIETRMLFTEGFGDDKPIVAAAKCSDSAANARIEIVFRQAIA